MNRSARHCVCARGKPRERIVSNCLNSGSCQGVRSGVGEDAHGLMPSKPSHLPGRKAHRADDVFCVPARGVVEGILNGRLGVCASFKVGVNSCALRRFSDLYRYSCASAKNIAFFVRIRKSAFRRWSVQDYGAIVVRIRVFGICGLAGYPTLHFATESATATT